MRRERLKAIRLKAEGCEVRDCSLDSVLRKR